MSLVSIRTALMPLAAMVLIAACKEKASTAADSQVEEAFSSEHTLPGDPAKRPGHEMATGTPTPAKP
jgi:hypothetical protein